MSQKSAQATAQGFSTDWQRGEGPARAFAIAVNSGPIHSADREQPHSEFLAWGLAKVSDVVVIIEPAFDVRCLQPVIIPDWPGSSDGRAQP